MIRVDAPNFLKPSLGHKPHLFLAGGITNTPVWQDVVMAGLSDLDVVVLNPRRKQWPDDPKEIEKQIEWEFGMIRHADVVSFWFPKETLCPITLFELGSMLNRPSRVPIIVGCDPEYARAFDLEIQVGLIDRNIKIMKSLDSFIARIREEFV